MRRIILFLLFVQFGYSQNTCDCKQVLDFVQNQIENNSASYQHQTVEYKRENEYKKHKNQINKITSEIKTQKECIGLISLYLSFLKDSHQWVSVTNDYYPFFTFEDSVSVKKFLSENVENFPLKKYKANPKSIQGYWFYEKGMFEIQIQPNKTKGRKFAGIQTTPLQYYVKKGDVRVDFYTNYENKLYAVFWDFGQKPKTFPVIFEDNKLKIGRNYVFVRDKNEVTENKKSQLKNETFFEELSEKTNYIRVHNFWYENKKSIDSVLAFAHNRLIDKENLIIDIRGNGGGNDLSYFPLLSYILENKEYTHPFKVGNFISRENLDYYESIKYKYGVKTKKDSLDADNEIIELKKYLGRFTPQEFGTNEIDTVYSNKIKNIFIVVDKEVASSAESFIKTSQLSAKNIKIIGENTGGVLQYGEWRRVDIPNFPAWISISQKKWEYSDKIDLEVIGIKPDIQIDVSDEECIKKVQNILERIK